MIVGELRAKLAQVPGDWSVAIVGRDGERRLVTRVEDFSGVSRYVSRGQPVASPFRYVRLDSRVLSKEAGGYTAAGLDEALAGFDQEIRVQVYEGHRVFGELAWVEESRRCLWLHHLPEEQEA